MLKKILTLFSIFLSISILAQNSPEKEAIISVERIWDRAEHSAFTSLIFHSDKFYCAFREGTGHTPGINGTIRIIASNDGQNWYSVAHIHVNDVDLRDPQLSVSPDNRIMLNIGGSVYNGSKLLLMHPMVSFSDKNGNNFSSPQKIELDKNIKTGKDWLWKATWHNNIVYAAVYQPTEKGSIVRLVKSSDGISYSYITTFEIPGSSNETTLRFSQDGRMAAVVRRDGKSINGYIGESENPYTEWKWNKFDNRIGGPDFVILTDGKMICGCRHYLINGTYKMILARITTAGNFTKLLSLPSGGDCSYPGLVIKEDILYVSYYSSHEDKTAIYFAKIRLEQMEHWLNLEVTPNPYLKSDSAGTIKLACSADDAEIRYTFDGSLPTESEGHIYQKPITVSGTTTLHLQAFQQGKLKSNIVSAVVGIDVLQEAQILNTELRSGLTFDYFEGEVFQVNDIIKLPLIERGRSAQFSINKSKRDKNFALSFSGYIKIPRDGSYIFYLLSNDGSKLYLNNHVLINNDAPHTSREKSITISLRQGHHKIAVKYFQMGGGKALQVFWKRPGFNKEEIPDSVLYHKK